ncbi:3-oxoacyl-(acyl-carrier-protein) synthase 2 [Ketogulonicigenium vulgare Y25]|nr:3-oxoacyl-(acyl-carrier-protein) synthase 2 [Ketogulonicigenium vulgare Y25]
MRRVVVTGLGLVTPLADGVEESWSRLLDGQSGAGPIKQFDASHLATTYACEVPLGDGTDGTFNADRYMEPKDQRKVDDFIIFGVAAAQQAVEDSGWVPQTDEDRFRTGVMIGSGIGGLKSIAETAPPRRSDQGKGGAPRLAFLYSGRADQPDLGSGRDQTRL